jgi:hypothetical protein
VAEADFLELLSEVVTIKKQTAPTSNGFPTPLFAAAKSYPGSYQPASRYGSKMIRTLDGNEKVASTIVLVDTGYLFINGVPIPQAADPISPADRLQLPDGSTTPILRVEAIHDESGLLHHTVVYA